MLRFTFFLIGFGLMVIGSVYIIIYLNLMSLGFNYIAYLNFIIGRIECLFLPIGLTIVTLSIVLERKKI